MIKLSHIKIIFLLGLFQIGAATGVLAGELPLVEVLHKIQEKYEVVLSYNTKDVKKISVDFEWKMNDEFDSAINRALNNTGLKYKSVGLNFYVIFKNNRLNNRKVRKIKRKIEQIKRLGNNDDFIISDRKTLSDISDKKSFKTLKGKVVGQNGEGLLGATVMIAGKVQGTTSDTEGNFELKTPQDIAGLVISYTGYATKEVNILGKNRIEVQLDAGLPLQGVTVFGSRGAPRTRFDSPVPIDNFTIKTLKKTGKVHLDEQLSQLVPSFNSGQHPVSDASAHINPIDLRGLLPSRTLVLINGKRKNASALLYSYVTASRGEVGVDLKSVSTDGIRAVEVLRDGSAAQYGSDAIAGVINLDLKRKIKPFANASYSITGQSDGMQFNAATGFSMDILDQGFATFTLGYTRQNRSQRAGKITSAADEANHWGTSIFSKEDFKNYIHRNPGAGFQVGLPDMNAFNATLNSAYILNKNSGTELYAFGTLMNRRGRSPQFARGPYWVPGFEAIYPDADFFLPEMAPHINDQMLSTGLKHNWKGWKMDLSTTFGNSRIDYFIKNSFNQSLGSASPKDFYNGAHQFSHFVNNFDVNKTMTPTYDTKLNVAFGAEQRIEYFKGFVGEFASYGDGTPGETDRIGSESFSGLSPNDAVNGSRNNIGFYTEMTGHWKERFQLGAAARYEHYSDFGGNLSWKFTGLFKAIPEKLNFRGAISSGFRAPSLHQIYYTSTTTTLTPGGVVQNRILNNLDAALRILNIPRLMPEKSFNLSMGLSYKPTKNICFAFDAYQISVKDRIVLSGQINRQSESNSPINQLLERTHTGSAGFFLNAVNTGTSGVDLVFNIKNISLGKGKLTGNIAANYNYIKVTDLHLPDFIEGNHLRDEVFSREDISRLETWRPRQKIMLSGSYSINKFSTSVGVNYFGSVTYRHPNDPADDATYGGKFITDWSIAYNLNSKIKWQLGVNNLFNVYPDRFSEVYNGVPNDRNIDFVGRFQYPWQMLQVGIDGIRAFTNVAFEF